MKKVKTKKPVKRQAIKTTKPIRSGLELLKMANRVDLQRYAAEGLSSQQKRAMIAIEHLKDNDKTAWLDEIICIQFARAKGGLSEDQAISLIHVCIEDMAREDKEIKRLSKAIDAKRTAAGLDEDDEWPDDKMPKDVEALYDEWNDRFLQLKVAILRHNEEDKLADLLLNDPDAYQARVTKGWQSMQKKAGGIPGQVK